MQLGASGTANILEGVFGVSMAVWAAAMGYLNGLCNSAGVMLNDVEFCVARKADGSRPKVFLIDFDKVALVNPSGIHPDESKKSMFPYQFSEYMTEYERGRKFRWQGGHLESLLRGAQEASRGLGDRTLAMGTYLGRESTSQRRIISSPRALKE